MTVKNALKMLFKKNKESPRSGYALSDEDRELSIIKRQLKAQLRRQEKLSDIREMKLLLNEVQGDKEESGGIEETALLMMLGKLFNSSNQEGNTSFPFPFTTPPIGTTPFGDDSMPVDDSLNGEDNKKTSVSFTNEELENILDKLPKKYRKIGSSLPDDTLKKLILGQMPYITDESLDSAVDMVKGRI